MDRVSDPDGPRYKLCTFLFGNVDKRGQLEGEYAEDEELSSINHIDNCRVSEVETSIRSIVSDAVTRSPLDANAADADSSVEAIAAIEPKDYYDESEVIHLDTIENALPAIHNEDYDDYDEQNETGALEDYPALPPQPPGMSCARTGCHSPLPQSSCWFSNVSPISKCPSEPSSPGNKGFLCSHSLPGHVLAMPVEEKISVNMPPPLHPAPVAASRQQCAISPQRRTSAFPVADSTDQRALNTPLGSLLPPEYGDVNITTVFPHYSPDRIPRWGRLFSLPYPPRRYEPLKHEPIYDYQEDSGVGSRPTADRPHLIFRNYLDLGQLPTEPEGFVQADQEDEVRQLLESDYPGPMADITTYLAGAERSWWQIAFSERLAEVELELANPSMKTTSRADDGTTWKENRRCNKKNKDGSSTSDTSTGETSSTDAVNDAEPLSKFNTWRYGPAKYWYDQLDIPDTADITKWRDWRKNTTSRVPPDTNPRVNPLTTVGAVLNEPMDVDAVSESPAGKNYLSPLVDSSVHTENEEEADQTVGDEEENFPPFLLTQWEDDIIYDAQLSSHKVTSSAKQNAAYAGWIPSQHCRTMAAFQDTYQGEYPGILGYKTLTGSSNPQQLLAGIPAAAAVSSADLRSSNPSALLLSLTSPHATASNGPYASFPVENSRILDDSWRFDIIYDPSSTAANTPFLLTMNKNDERCVLDTVINDDEIMAMTAMGKQASALGSQPGGFHQEGGGSATAANRASFHVTFGFASTKGTLTGALAKDEKGAEKVKRILGKHGFLADGDWNAESPENADDHANDEDHHPDPTTENMASVAAAASGLPPRDPLNLSNDEFYAIRSGGLFGTLARCGPLQHSTPAVELWPPFFPTYNTPHKLRQFHRIPLKQYTRGVMSQYGVPVVVSNLTRVIQKKAKEREEEKMAAGGGEIFFMRSPQDLSAFDGEIVLFEYTEEFPPLMNQIGMATRLVNYYRPLQPKDPSLSPDPSGSGSPPDLPFGSLVNVGNTDSPFLGVVRPGGCLQSMENNMFRAPIHPHRTPSTDFLVIRNRNGLWIRRVPNSFTVGQEVPLMEVPGPNSKRANNFARDFLQVYILRLFLKSTDEPKRIKMEEIRLAFPNHSESSVRKRLKICADFKRTGSDASWWVLRPDYRLPSEEEIRYLVQPEDFCAFFSMQAAELRLKDAGYGEKSLFDLDENPEEEENKEGQPKREDEVRAAPWNTTRAYLAAQRGGCFLELHGPADPTGCGEAFSYSKTSAKPGALFRQAGGEVARGLLKDKKMVTGTDADLRKLHLREARALLRSFGISEADLKTFKRWEIIDMVRFTSTERAKQGEEESTAKFARGNRLSMSEQIRCYREECQRIFDLQNRVLSNPELLSSDEEEEEPSSDEEEEEDAETNLAVDAGRSTGMPRISGLHSQSARNVQSLMTNKITSEELKERQEEVDREELKRSVELGKSISSSSGAAAKQKRRNQLSTNLVTATTTTTTACTQPADGGTASSDVPSVAVFDADAASAGSILDLPPPFPNAQKKMLRIVRTYRGDGSDSKDVTRVEQVPWSAVVEIYLKIKQTRDADQIHNFVGSDEAIKEQQRKEKRRIQDQLRRVRKQQELLRARGATGTSGQPLRDASGRLIPSNRLSSVIGGTSTSSALATPSSSSRRRHKPNSNILKMRCGACGQIGHMRTNKECPMYGRGDAAVASPSGLTSGAGGGGGGGGGGGTGINSHRGPTVTQRRGAILPPGVEPETVAAAQELTSKPVAELLAASTQHGGGDASSMEDGEWPTSVGPRSIGASRLSDNSDDDFPLFERRSHHEFYDGSGDEFGSLDGSRRRFHDAPPRRPDLKMTISKQLLDRLDAASLVVRCVEAANQLGGGGGGGGGRGGQGGASGRGGGASSGRGRRGAMASAADDDYPTTTIKHRGNRRRIDPRVAINHIFEGIYKGLLQIPDAKTFLQPVNPKKVPNYYIRIKNPMDLSKIRMKIRENEYSTREEFLNDIRRIHDNCSEFNGPQACITETAKKMCSYVVEEFCQKENKLMRLEPLVNPLLDENDLVRLGFLLQKAVDAMRTVENSRPFHFPVEKRRYPNYPEYVNRPMDLSTLEKNIRETRYHSRDEFYADVCLLKENSSKYNGPDCSLTDTATKMVEVARVTLDELAETIRTIEDNIQLRLDDISMADSQSQHGGGGPASVDMAGPSSYSVGGAKPSTTAGAVTGGGMGSRVSSSQALLLSADDLASVESSKRRRMDGGGDDLSSKMSNLSEPSRSIAEDDDDDDDDDDTNDCSPSIHGNEARLSESLQPDSEREEIPHRPATPRNSHSLVDEDSRFSAAASEGTAANLHAPHDPAVMRDLFLTSSEGSSDDLSDPEGGEMLLEDTVVEHGDEEDAQPHHPLPPQHFSPDLASEPANDGYESQPDDHEMADTNQADEGDDEEDVDEASSSVGENEDNTSDEQRPNFYIGSGDEESGSCIKYP